MLPPLSVYWYCPLVGFSPVSISRTGMERAGACVVVVQPEGVNVPQAGVWLSLTATDLLSWNSPDMPLQFDVVTVTVYEPTSCQR